MRIIRTSVVRIEGIIIELADEFTTRVSEVSILALIDWGGQSVGLASWRCAGFAIEFYAGKIRVGRVGPGENDNG